MLFPYQADGRTQSSKAAKLDAMLKRTDDSIKRSQAHAAESEQIGVAVLGDMHQQRDKIAGTRDRIEETHDNVSRGGKFIRDMRRRATTITFVMYCSVIVLIFAIIMVLWVTWIKNYVCPGVKDTFCAPPAGSQHPQNNVNTTQLLALFTSKRSLK